MPAGIAFIVLCLFGMVALPYWSSNQIAHLRKEVRETVVPLEITLERLHREVLGMANDLQGFLLTRDSFFSATLRDQERSVRADFAKARKLAARVDDPLARHVMAAEAEYAVWRTHIRRALAVTRKEGMPTSVQEELSRAGTRLQTFSARVERLGHLVQARENQLEERLAAFQRTERSLVLVLGTLAAIVVAYLTWLAVALLRAQRLALEERDQLETVLRSVDSGILLLDRDLRVAVANERAGELLGIPLHRLVGSDQRRIVREHLKPAVADPEAFEKRLIHLYDNPDAVAEDKVEMVLPQPRTLTRYSSPVRDVAGVAFGRIEVYRDVSDMLRRERELAEANERKDRFVATLSHELRTPLTPIFGWIELLRRERDPEKIEQGLKAIRRNVSLQAQLVEDLLDLSKVVNQKLELDFRTMDVASAVAAAVDTVRHRADAKSVRLRTLLPKAPLTVVADETRFIQIVWNLVSNAIKFSPPGTSVTLAADVTDSRLRVVVEDEGEGIAPDLLEHIFKPFEQGRDARQRRSGGLGVGLALARSLVELHGGEITAESEGPGKGARFTFWIPLAPVRRARRPEIEPAQVGAADPAQDGFAPSDTAGETSQSTGLTRVGHGPAGSCQGDSRQRVLIVEDNPDTLEAMRILLASWGYKANGADDVASALSVVESEPPDVIISDIGMPHVDGLAFAREVRRRLIRNDRNGRTLLIAITGFASAADRSRALAAGFDAYLTKPIDFTSLKSLLERLAPRVTEPLQE